MSLGYVQKLRYGRRLFARRFDGGSHVLGALEGASDVVVVGAAVEGEQLQAMWTLHLKAIANPLDPLAEYHRAFRAFDFDLSFDHGSALVGQAIMPNVTVLLKAQKREDGQHTLGLGCGSGTTATTSFKKLENKPMQSSWPCPLMVCFERLGSGSASPEALKNRPRLEVARVAPDIARTAASSHCCSLKQIADDMRG